MFGYLQPKRDELRVREYELYKSVYCGLCRHLGKDYGIISRLTLSYDCTVFAMLAMSLCSDKCHVSRKCCVCNPVKKCFFCDCEGESLRFAGAVSVIMTYYKLEDTVRDSGFFKKTVAVILRAVFHRNYQKAAKAYPKIDSVVDKMMKEQLKAENQDSSIDRSAEPTAHLVSDLCNMISQNSPDDSQHRVLEVFGYFIGRWIYITDAADDLEKDIRHNNFNPFRQKYNDCGGDIRETMEYCNSVLNMTAAQIVAAYDLLELNSYKEILDNVIYDGLSFQQKRCLFDKYKDKKKRKRNKDYYKALSERQSREVEE